MAMKPCNNCGENNWGDFKEIDGYVTAVCQECGNDVEFLARQAKKQQERMKLPEYQVLEKLDTIIDLLKVLIEK